MQLSFHISDSFFFGQTLGTLTIGEDLGVVDRFFPKKRNPLQRPGPSTVSLVTADICIPRVVIFG